MVLPGTISTLNLLRPPPLSGETPAGPRRIIRPTKVAFSFLGVSVSTKPWLRSISPTLLPRASSSSESANEANFRHQDGSGIRTVSDNDAFASCRGLLDFTASNFLPIALVCGVALGITFPALGCQASRLSLSKYAVFGIFFISGLRLQDGEVGEMTEAWPAVVYGLVFILLFSPFFSRLLLELQLKPQEFVTGLALFSCMPTTLTSGVALTQLAGANSAVALAVTVGSNLLGTFLVPFWVSKFIAEGFGVTIPVVPLFRSLLTTLLVPLIFGKVCRNSIDGLASVIDQNRRPLFMISTILLSLTPWMQVSKSKPMLMMVEPTVFVGAIFMGIIVHLSFLLLNSFMVKWVSYANIGCKAVFSKRENARALILVCSQRVLLIAVAVIEQLGGALGEPGLLVLPCIAAHINQIIIDSLLVSFWLQKDEMSSVDQKK